MTKNAFPALDDISTEDMFVRQVVCDGIGANKDRGGASLGANG